MAKKHINFYTSEFNSENEVTNIANAKDGSIIVAKDSTEGSNAVRMYVKGVVDGDYEEIGTAPSKITTFEPPIPVNEEDDLPPANPKVVEAKPGFYMIGVADDSNVHYSGTIFLPTQMQYQEDDLNFFISTDHPTGEDPNKKLSCVVSRVGDNSYRISLSDKNGSGTLCRSVVEWIYPIVNIPGNTTIPTIEPGDYRSWGISYSLLNGTLEVTGIGNHTGTGLVIPSSAMFNKSIKTVSSIASYAFTGSSDLQEVFIYGGKNIGNSAFSTCQNLSSVSLDGSSKVFGSSVFSGCINLSTVTFDEYDSSTPYNLGTGTFNGCTKLKTIDLTNTKTQEIGDRLFNGCTGLETVTIPSTVTEIGDQAFYNCSSLKDIYYDGTQLQWSEITKGSDWEEGTGDYVIHCTDAPLYKYSLTFVPIENTNTCKLTAVSPRVGETIETLVVPNTAQSGEALGMSVVEIDPDALSQISSTVKSITIPNSVTTIGAKVFKDCSVLEFISIPRPQIIAPYTAPWVGTLFNCTDTSTPTYSDNVFPASLKSIKITYWDGISYGSSSYLFKNASGIAQIDVADALDDQDNNYYIENDDMAGCGSLEELNVAAIWSTRDSSSSYATIGKWFGTAQYTGGVATVQHTGYSSTATYYIPASLNKITSIYGIGRNALENCINIEEVTLSEDAFEINEYAFDGCTGLKTLQIFGDGTKIQTLSFTGVGSAPLENLVATASMCGSIMSVVNHQYLKNVNVTYGDTISASTFKNCTALLNVTLTDTLTSVGDEAFAGCSSVTSLSIPEGVISVGNHAFNGCGGITSIPTGLRHIGNYAFSETDLTSVTLQYNNISFGDGAFKNCHNLTAFTSVSDITKGHRAEILAGCESLVSLSIPFATSGPYSGASAGAYFTYQTLHYDLFYLYGESQPAGFYSATAWEKYVRGGSTTTSIIGQSYIPSALKKISVKNASHPGASGGLYYAYKIFNTLSSVEEIEITNNNESWQSGGTHGDVLVGTEQFSGCTGLKKVTLPSTIQQIKSDAFTGCTSLNTIIFSGTRTQWDAVNKESGWDSDFVPGYTVHCTDGDINL